MAATFEQMANTGPMALNIHGTADLIGWLPPGASDKLKNLRQRAADLNRLIPKLTRVMNIMGVRPLLAAMRA